MSPMGHQSNAQQLHLKGSSRSDLNEQLAAAAAQRSTRWPDASSAPHGSGNRHGTARERANDMALARNSESACSTLCDTHHSYMY